jgi:HAT1-interacting factor 1
LKEGPVDIEGLKSALGMSGGNSMGGILETTIGETPAEAAARVEEAKKGANDLTGLVRKKDKRDTNDSGTPEVTVNANGKRKAGEDPDEDSETSKKAKVEDVAE